MKFVNDQGLTTPPVLAEEKRRLLSAQADLAELKLKQQAGELVLKTDVLEDTAKMMTALVGILKKTLSREDFNSVARQFQKVEYQG